MVARAVYKLSYFYGTQRFYTMLNRTVHGSPILSHKNPIHAYFYFLIIPQTTPIWSHSLLFGIIWIIIYFLPVVPLLFIAFGQIGTRAHCADKQSRHTSIHFSLLGFMCGRDERHSVVPKRFMYP
jgi:hypothetical protein